MSSPPRVPPPRDVRVPRGAAAALVAMLLATLVGPRGVRAVSAADAVPLPFHRVHVPAGRIDDVPLGPDRLVPLPLEEFEEALRAAGAGTDAAPRSNSFPKRATEPSSGATAASTAR